MMDLKRTVCNHLFLSFYILGTQSWNKVHFHNPCPQPRTQHCAVAIPGNNSLQLNSGSQAQVQAFSDCEKILEMKKKIDFTLNFSMSHSCYMMKNGALFFSFMCFGV